MVHCFCIATHVGFAKSGEQLDLYQLSRLAVPVGTCFEATNAFLVFQVFEKDARFLQKRVRRFRGARRQGRKNQSENRRNEESTHEISKTKTLPVWFVGWGATVT